MKVLIFLVSFFSLLGCVQEKKVDRDLVIKKACAQIAVTRNFESSERARIWNAAVEELGQTNFFSSSTDFIIKNGSDFGPEYACRDNLGKG